MINIFLDSNILYSDPLMQKGKNKVLFDKINRIGGKIFICDVVYKEVLNNYKKQLNEINLAIKKIKSKMDKLKYDSDAISNIDIASKINEIKKAFEEYNSQRKIIILPIDNEILPEVVDRSIKRKKPFSENKQEFRDCIIWLTYARKIENDNLDNCIFITKNTSDFCDNKGNLHKDLLEDTEKFRFHSDAYQFLENESGLISEIEINEITERFKNYTISENEFERKEIFHEIRNSIYNYFISLSEDSIADLYGGMYINYIELDGIDIESITKKSSDIDINDLTITEFGDIEIEASVELRVYDEEKDWNIATTTILLKCSYWAQVKIINQNDEGENNYMIDEKINEIEIDTIKVKEIDGSVINEYYNDLKSAAYADMMEAQEDYYRH